MSDSIETIGVIAASSLLQDSKIIEAKRLRISLVFMLYFFLLDLFLCEWFKSLLKSLLKSGDFMKRLGKRLHITVSKFKDAKSDC